MKDTKINNFKLNARDELSFKVTIKPNDYSIAERELLREAENNGNMLDLEIIGLINGDIEQHKKIKLQILSLNMQTYCDKANIKIEEEKEKLYIKYKVTSRKDMKIEDIEREIDSYKMGIFEFSN